MTKNNLKEEVTITPVIKDLERLAIKLFQLIGLAFESIGNFFFFIFKLFVKRSRLFLILGIIGVCLGAFSFFSIKETAKSSLTITLNIDAKAQLENDINYFNALIEKDQFEILADIFSLSETEANHIVEFEVEPYISYVEQLRIYNDIYEDLDSNVRKNLNFNDVLQSEYKDFLTSKYVISVFAKDEKIFSKIEKPLMNFLERVPELQEQRVEKKSVLEYKKSVLEKEIADLDTLKKVYNKALIAQARASGSPRSETTIQLGKSENAETFTVLNIHEEYINRTNELSRIVSTLKKLDGCYQVHSHFSGFGEQSSYGFLIKMLTGLGIAILFGFLYIFIQFLHQKIED